MARKHDGAEPAAPGMDASLVRLSVRPDTTYVSSGRTVLATELDGFLNASADHGLFVHETRLISRYRWGIEGRTLHPVSLSNVTQRSWLGYYIILAPLKSQPDYKAPTAAASIYKAAQQAVELRLSRYVGEGLHEDVDLTNFTQETVALRLTLEIGADFADQSETHDERQQRGKCKAEWSANSDAWEWRADYEAHHRYNHQGEKGEARLRRGIAVRFNHADTEPSWNGKTVSFDITLAPHEQWHCCVDHAPIIDGKEMTPRYGCRSFAAQDNEYDRKSQLFLREATSFASRESETLAHVVVGALEQGKR
ncbi:MAG TPA: glycogen debranching N-terminal domain-containing protein, partial [Candidatus Binatia bacterium]|nr:glycogen debranching N-terminal domain-containing protein [Candidatus Binatia bacterium]